MRKVILFVVCLFFLALIIGLIVPAFLPYKPPQKIVCQSHIKELAIICLVYQHEKGDWPDTKRWNDLIKSYTEEEDRVFRLCPTDKTGPCSYAMNENIPADVNNLPGDLVLLFESTPGWNRIGGPTDVVTNRHDKKNPASNIAFADGHVEFITADKIPSLRWTIIISSSAQDSK